jgi:uncharacterized protein HemX
MADEPKPESAESTSKPAPDVADDEDLDVVIQRVEPKRGCSGVAWVLFIIILALIAVIGSFWYQNQKANEKARDLLQQTCATVEGNVNETIQDAARLAGEGDIAAAMERLKAAQAKLEGLATQCNSQKAIDLAERYKERTAFLSKSVNELAGLQKQADELTQKIAELEKQRDAINAQVREKILSLGGSGQPAQPAGAEGTNAAAPATPEPTVAPAQNMP